MDILEELFLDKFIVPIAGITNQRIISIFRQETIIHSIFGSLFILCNFPQFVVIIIQIRTKFISHRWWVNLIVQLFIDDCVLFTVISRLSVLADIHEVLELVTILLVNIFEDISNKVDVWLKFNSVKLSLWVELLKTSQDTSSFSYMRLFCRFLTVANVRSPYVSSWKTIIRSILVNICLWSLSFPFGEFLGGKIKILRTN